MKEELLEQITCALDDSSPADALIVVAIKLRDNGMKQNDLCKLLESIFVTIEPDDPRYDAMEEMLDKIWGGPWAKQGALYPDELSDNKLRKGNK